MIHEIAHALVQRILHDKIILGLIIIGLLAVFMSGLNNKDEAPSASKSDKTDAGQQQEQQQTSGKASGVEPALAQDFIKWWLGMAMDYSPASAAPNHQQAFAWMSQNAAATFQSTYWTAEMASGVASGKIVAAFQPTSITAKALNPDGTVVVGVQGTYQLRNGGQPVPYQVKADFLVSRARDGLRITGVYNELATTSSRSVN